MIGDMGTVHITEAELARDLHNILAKVWQGVEVVVEQDHRPVAVLRPLNRGGRIVSDIRWEGRQTNSTGTDDANFGKDMEERQPAAAMGSVILEPAPFVPIPGRERPWVASRRASRVERRGGSMGGIPAAGR